MIDILRLMKERNVIPDHDTAKLVLETLVYSSDGVEFADEVKNSYAAAFASNETCAAFREGL